MRDSEKEEVVTRYNGIERLDPTRNSSSHAILESLAPLVFSEPHLSLSEITLQAPNFTLFVEVVTSHVQSIDACSFLSITKKEPQRRSFLAQSKILLKPPLVLSSRHIPAFLGVSLYTASKGPSPTHSLSNTSIILTHTSQKCIRCFVNVASRRSSIFVAIVPLFNPQSTHRIASSIIHRGHYNLDRPRLQARRL